MSNTRIGFGLAAALIAQPVVAQTTQAQQDAAFRHDFAAFLDQGMHRYPTIPALSVAVSHGSGPVMVTALGMADREARHPNNAATRFYIASSTKSFVALALARLAEKGEINLDWTLAQLAPDVRFAPGAQADKITLRTLLSHSHGLSGDALQYRLAYSGEWDQPTLLRLLGTLKPNPKAPFGTFAYSNLGYNVATLLIERRLHRSWQQIVEQEVLAPLALRDTAARGLARPADRAAPYDGMKRLYLRKSDGTMQSAGGMESSARDMARWLSANLQAERSQAGPLAAAMRLTHARFVATSGTYGPFTRAGYGFGWYSGPYEGQALYHAFGGFPGFRAHVSIVPEQDLGVALLSNDDGAGYRFVDVAAAYAYDWYRAGPAAARAAAAPRLAELDKQMADAAKPAAPPSPVMLSLPAAAYAGRYCSAEWGSIAIRPRGAQVEVAMGVLHAMATGGDADQLRAELVPGQSTRVGFEVAGKAVPALNAFGTKFERCLTYTPRPR